jgi:hypothetical protein
MMAQKGKTELSERCRFSDKACQFKYNRRLKHKEKRTPKRPFYKF